MFRLGFQIIEVIIGISALLFGLVLILKPKECIQMQQNFYKKINWKMEPLDYEKEVRNTRILGFVGIICGAILLVVLFKIV
jgi:hypothetical protein